MPIAAVDCATLGSLEMKSLRHKHQAYSDTDRPGDLRECLIVTLYEPSLPNQSREPNRIDVLITADVFRASTRSNKNAE